MTAYLVFRFRSAGDHGRGAMVLILLGLVLLGVFLWLSEAAHLGRTNARIVAAWEAAALGALAVYGALGAAVILLLRCDELQRGSASLPS